MAKRIFAYGLMLMIISCQANQSSSVSGNANEPVLVGTNWQWQGSFYNNDTQVKPDIARSYTIRFEPDGLIRVRADCNQVTGHYQIVKHRLVIQLQQSNLAVCPPGTKDSIYTKDLQAVQGYLFDKGDLILELKYDTGGMRFFPTD
jgi:heat shock protein HslJ